MRPMGDRKILLDGCSFLEGPRWHEGALYVSDMHGPRVLRVDASGAVTTVAEHSSPLSGLGWLPDGRMIVVDMEGSVLRLDGAGPVVHADLRRFAPYGINDMISHPDGWSWVGQFGYDRHAGQAVVASPLLRVDPDGGAMVAAEDLMVANGMCLSPDGRELLVAESAGGRITSFTVGYDGALSHRAVFAELPPRHAPDGMCLDADDAVWVAAVTAGAFVRVRRGGEVTDRIEVEEGRHAIACVLGGEERRTLFMLTATTFGDAEPSRAALAARVETLDVDVPGAGWP
jgi:sugar lactone lactonase YvrE